MNGTIMGHGSRDNIIWAHITNYNKRTTIIL